MEIKSLNYFGLSSNLAKVFISISGTRFLTAKEIQKRAGVPRQEIYAILTSLEELGLVEKTVGRPIRFKGVPIKQGLAFLIKKKEDEAKKMQKIAEKMMQNFAQKINNNKILDDKPHFVLVSKKEASINKRLFEIESAQTSIDFITSWKRFPRAIDTFGKSGKQALENNVKMRVILEKPENKYDVPKILEEFRIFPNFHLRYILKPPEAVIGVFDNKAVLIITSAKVGLAEKPSLWTDNPCLLAVIRDYFEIMWITAMEKIPEKLVD